MDIRLTEKAITDGVLRVWLRRIPEVSGFLHLFREGDTAPIGSATLYGRGEGSAAQERAMLVFRLAPSAGAEAGERVVIRIEGIDGLKDIALDVLEIE